METDGASLPGTLLPTLREFLGSGTDPGCSDRGAAPAAGLGPPGVGATPTPDPRVLPSARLTAGRPGVPGTPGPPAVDLPGPSHPPPVVAPYCVYLFPIPPLLPIHHAGGGGVGDGGN